MSEFFNLLAMDEVASSIELKDDELGSMGRSSGLAMGLVLEQRLDELTGHSAITANNISQLQISKSARLSGQGKLYGVTRPERAHVRSGGIVIVRLASEKYWFIHGSTLDGMKSKELRVAHATDEWNQLFEAELRRREMAAVIAARLTGNTEQPVAPVNRRLTRI